MSLVEKYNLKSLTSIDVLFLVLLVRHTFLSYFDILLSRMPIVGSESSLITSLIVIYIILRAVPQFVKQLKFSDYAFYCLCVLVFLSTYIFFPHNVLLLDDIRAEFLFGVLPFYFVGRTINYTQTKNFIALLSVLSIIAYYLLRLNNDVSDLNEGGDMHAAFRILPFLVFVVLYAFETKSMIYVLLSILFSFFLLSLGNRGSILDLIIFLCFALLYKLRNNKLIYQVLFISIISSILYLYYDDIINFLYDVLEENGYSVRVIEKLMNNEISDSMGRRIIYQKIFVALEKNIYGFGLMGDRLITGMYSHNIFLEFLSSFGYIIGGLLSLLLVYIFIKAFFKSKNTENCLFFLALLSFGLLPLLTSNTFLLYPEFFVLLGYSVKLMNTSSKSIRMDLEEYKFVELHSTK